MSRLPNRVGATRGSFCHLCESVAGFMFAAKLSPGAIRLFKAVSYRHEDCGARLLHCVVP